MKHKLISSVAVAVAACVACVLAFGAVFAHADVDAGLGGNNELIINVADGESDVKDANPSVRVYRIATGAKDANYDTYNYTFDVEPFAELGKGFDPATMTSDSWQRMAEAAQKIVADSGVGHNAEAAVGDKVFGLADGIYLVLLPEASSNLYTYTFAPALVAVPGKVGADGAPVYNTSAGRWTNTDPVEPVHAVVKWSRAQRYGSLQINKTVNNFSGEAATFVYHIVDAETRGQKFEAHAAVQYTAEGVQSATVGQIPAGLEVIVTEEYEGGRYRLVSDNGVPATIAADGVAEVSFVNEPNDSGKGGHGIENHFVFDESTNGGDWKLEVRAIDASEVKGNQQEAE